MIWKYEWLPQPKCLDDLSEDELAWVAMQGMIDDGLQWCAVCREFGWASYCGKCGRRYVGEDLEWRSCPKCSRQVTSDYCPTCGYRVVTDLIRALEEGTADVAAEERKAAEVMERFYAKRPELAPPGRAPGAAMAAAVNAVWGPHGR